MCKAHSKVTHIKQQNIFITSRAVDIIRIVYYIRGSAALDVMKIFLLFYMSLCYGPYIVIKQQFFTFIDRRGLCFLRHSV